MAIKMLERAKPLLPRSRSEIVIVLDLELDSVFRRRIEARLGSVEATICRVGRTHRGDRERRRRRGREGLEG